ncbi:SRPBCC family protein [Chryseobacterium sp. MP_3.2]|uniref:SRPBCC family protein n=1 Tax=Chryseobacterium sp. MP_3.2 TaxID=3071712 RepID=UPI002E045F1C|nr:uncharacterized protein YndB with AHSA1/START domain [Chryseobacterium sp. MP_3.2]
MKTLNYEIEINAPIEKVWEMLWNQEKYAEWTQFFGSGSVMKSDWEINGKTYFLDKNGDGMVSTIKTLNPPFEVVFSHLGKIENGVEDIASSAVEEWSGAEEKYFLRYVDQNRTHIQAIVHTMHQYEDHMTIGFRKGFDLLKENAEQI